MINILILFVILVFIIFLIDGLPQFFIWQNRIKIGRFSNQETWEQKIQNIVLRWVNKTPTIKLTDNNRLIIIDILKGNYKRKSIQSWQEAALILGLKERLKKNKNDKFIQELNNFVGKTIDKSGSWRVKPEEVDSAMLAFAIMKDDRENLHKNKPAFDYIYNLIKSLVGVDGTVAYRKSTPNFRFVDTVGFVSPFLVNYGVCFKNEEAINLGLKQISEYVENGFSAKEKLPCHTYDLETKNLVGLTGWGRGLAWFIIGLTDTWKILPKNSIEKKKLEKEMIKNFENILKFQDSDGSFHWLLTDKISRKDSSVTSVLAWFFSECESFPEIKENAKTARKRCLNYLKSVTRRNGAVDFSQGDTKGIGIYSQNFDIMPFTQGFCLRAFEH